MIKGFSKGRPFGMRTLEYARHRARRAIFTRVRVVLRRPTSALKPPASPVSNNFYSLAPFTGSAATGPRSPRDRLLLKKEPNCLHAFLQRLRCERGGSEPLSDRPFDSSPFHNSSVVRPFSLASFENLIEVAFGLDSKSRLVALSLQQVVEVGGRVAVLAE
jgi:hypothetical protein